MNWFRCINNKMIDIVYLWCKSFWTPSWIFIERSQTFFSLYLLRLFSSENINIMSSAMYIFVFITIYVINVDFIKTATYQKDYINDVNLTNKWITKHDRPYCIRKSTKLALRKIDFEVENAIRIYFQSCITKVTSEKWLKLLQFGRHLGFKQKLFKFSSFYVFWMRFSNKKCILVNVSSYFQTV